MYINSKSSTVFVFLSYVMCIIYLTAVYECVACWDILFFFIWSYKMFPTFTSIITIPQLWSSQCIVKRNEKVWMLLYRKQILQYKSCHLLYVWLRVCGFSFGEWKILQWRCFWLGWFKCYLCGGGYYTCALVIFQRKVWGITLRFWKFVANLGPIHSNH